MLLILYGATAKMGDISRQYLIGAGFEKIEKYNYAPQKPKISTFYGERKYVSKEEFFENTDSLFRYEVGGILIGFNQQQISDAVCNKSDALLTLSTDNIDFLPEIKRIYGENVCTVYAYLDDSTLRNITYGLPNITDMEAEERLKIGHGVKRNFVENPTLFDRVVIYGGEDSAFDKKSLIKQYDAIIASIKPEICLNSSKKHSDVFISYARRDVALYTAIKARLEECGISVFSDEDILLGSDFLSQIKDEIQNARVVIPVISESALRSDYIRAEIGEALNAAEGNGTLVLPFFYGELDSSVLDKVFPELTTKRCIMAKFYEVDGAVSELAERVSTLLSSENELKKLSKQLENYHSLRMYDQALELQRTHLGICEYIYSLAGDDWMDIEVCLMSRIKLIDLLMYSNSPKEALKYIIEGIIEDDDSSVTYDMLWSRFIGCCVLCKMDEDEVYNLISSEISDDERILEEQITAFAAAKIHAEKPISEEADETSDSNESEIAKYGELVMDLFDTIIGDEEGTASDYDLIIGYERILNYCKHIGLKGDIANKCITRISELKAECEEMTNKNSSGHSEALKIYLGQATPMSGEYDVFLSYKSEDEALARKVYDYLTQSGKEVFFSGETLEKLGESEYEDMIFDAIERSRHMIVIGSNPEYFKTRWVKDEWRTFNNEIREGRKNGNLLLVLTDDIADKKGSLPTQLRHKEIVKMSEYRTRIMSYLR